MADAPLVAISGASGLIGSAFMNKYSASLRLTKILKMKSLTYDQVLSEIESISASGTKSLLHLAWPASSSSDNYRISEDNFDALRKTILTQEACSQFGINFIGIGTILDKVSSVDSYYQMAKFTCRQMFRREIAEERITWVRPYFVFNNNSWPGFLHVPKKSSVRILNDSPRDFIHLDDVVSGLFTILEKEIRGEIDLGSRRLTKPSELCEKLGKNYIIESADSGEASAEYSTSAAEHPLLSQHWAPTKTHALLKEMQQ
jgi:nucleoside-diphosphate-sugar epimerase